MPQGYANKHDLGIFGGDGEGIYWKYKPTHISGPGLEKLTAARPGVKPLQEHRTFNVEHRDLNGVNGRGNVIRGFSMFDVQCHKALIGTA